MEAHSIYYMEAVFTIGNHRTKFDNHTFSEVVDEIVVCDRELGKEPLAIIFPETSKIMYYDRASFSAYFDEQISVDVLEKETWCEGLFRNKLAFANNQGEEIDPGSLWMLRDNECILIDDDHDVITDFDPKLFQTAI